MTNSQHKSFRIEFDVDADPGDLDERMRFWDSTRDWFSDQGYTLYKAVYTKNEYAGGTDFSRWIPSLGSVEDYKYEHPYAHVCGDPPPHEFAIPLSGEADVHGRILYAQDSKSRHVAMKVMKIDSEEYRISRFLSQAECPEGILPILDFLEHDEHCFVVMPRWGTIVLNPWFSSVKEVLHFIHVMLKALSFLHENLIIHRDIKTPNMLVNHFWTFPYDDHRVHLRSEGRITYALFDFDRAMVLKPGQRCLPSHFSWIGGIDPPDDTSHGELEYDPFAFDVGCLGVIIIKHFKQICPYAPLLAPLMDNMINPNIEDRFTASQALQFFEDSYPHLTPEQLDTVPPPKDPGVSWRADASIRWDTLPEELAQKWSMYRLPPKPPYMKILQRICDPDWGLQVVQWARRAIRLFTVFFAFNGSSKLGRL